jgi:DNA-directed RNA polymerase specialized sigma24 family protein
MKKYWQMSRDYRKIRNHDGAEIHVIRVKNVDVEVNNEKFNAYAKADRRERYCYERDQQKLWSLEKLAEDGVLEMCWIDHAAVASAEDQFIQKCAAEMFSKAVANALSNLAPNDLLLIMSVVINGKTERDYAKEINTTQVAVHNRKKRILKKLQEIILDSLTE